MILIVLRVGVRVRALNIITLTLTLNTINP
jgi:hypothetical protein